MCRTESEKQIPGMHHQQSNSEVESECWSILQISTDLLHILRGIPIPGHYFADPELVS